MSIYRTDEHFAPTDDRVDREPRATGAPAQPETDWTRRRRTEPANGLLKPTFAWASTLPVQVQPRSLLYKFPRIANLTAAMWPDPDSFRRYIDDLLVDKRGNRHGFPVDVLEELFELRAYYYELYPDNSSPWESLTRTD